MTLHTYITNIYSLREITDRLCRAADLLNIEIFETPIGKLYDFVYEMMVPNGASDEDYDRFSRFIFEEEPPSEEEMAEFYYTIFSSN